MAFHVKPQREFLVRPALPPSLSRMSELAYNLLWSWDHNMRALFRRLDSQLWKACGNNPVLMLGRVSQATLERAATDPRYLSLYRRACERYDSYMQTREREQRQADRLLLDGVRPDRVPAHLLGRPGFAVRRSSEIVQRRRTTP